MPELDLHLPKYVRSALAFTINGKLSDQQSREYTIVHDAFTNVLKNFLN